MQARSRAGPSRSGGRRPGCALGRGGRRPTRDALDLPWSARGTAQGPGWEIGRAACSGTASHSPPFNTTLQRRSTGVSRRAAPATCRRGTGAQPAASTRSAWSSAASCGRSNHDTPGRLLRGSDSKIASTALSGNLTPSDACWDYCRRWLRRGDRLRWWGRCVIDLRETHAVDRVPVGGFPVGIAVIGGRV